MISEEQLTEWEFWIGKGGGFRDDAVAIMLAEIRALRKVVNAAAAYKKSVEFDGQPNHEEYAALCKAIKEWEG